MAEIEASLLAKVQSAESAYERPVLIGFLHSRKKRIGTLIEAASGQSLKELKREIKKNGGKKLKLYPEIHTIYAEMPVDKVEGLTSLSCAQKIYDAEREITPSLYESAPVVLGIERWQFPYRVRGKKIEGKGVKIALIDSGIDRNHPDFGWMGWRIEVVKNFSKGKKYKGTQHGTHVAGIAAGSGKASGYRFSGIAPKARLYVAKVFPETGKARIIDVFDAIRWAIKKKVDVINLSLGTNWCTDGSCPLCRVADYAVERGISVVVSAGNGGPGPNTISCPGNARQAITVGASTKKEPFWVTFYSSRGALQAPLKPEMVAPGECITSTKPGGGYQSMNGTSMAAPHVAGLAALLYQASKYLGRKTKPTPAEIKAWLIQGCVDLGQHPSAQGNGLVNFDKTIKSLYESTKRARFPLFRKKATQPTSTHSSPSTKERVEVAASVEPQEASAPATCPAALNMFCPHYDKSRCDKVYENCIHYQQATQKKILQAIRQ